MYGRYSEALGDYAREEAERQRVSEKGGQTRASKFPQVDVQSDYIDRDLNWLTNFIILTEFKIMVWQYATDFKVLVMQ